MTSSTSPWEEELLGILNKLQAKKESGWFSVPVEWEALGLMDYPLVVKQPIDLKTIKEKMEQREYASKATCAADIRRVWSNAMLYNTVGSKVYVAAKSCCEYFESLYTADAHDRLPTAQELSNFVDICFRLSSEEMGKVLLLLERHCGRCLYRNKDTNEVEVNVDLMSGAAFLEATKLLNIIAPNVVKDMSSYSSSPGDVTNTHNASGEDEHIQPKKKDPRGRKPKVKLTEQASTTAIAEGDAEQQAHKKSKKIKEKEVKETST